MFYDVFPSECIEFQLISWTDWIELELTPILMTTIIYVSEICTDGTIGACLPHSSAEGHRLSIQDSASVWITLFLPVFVSCVRKSSGGDRETWTHVIPNIFTLIHC